jgi:hypothetical protein
VTYAAHDGPAGYSATPENPIATGRQDDDPPMWDTLGAAETYNPVTTALRLRAVMRMLGMNSKHGLHAWDRRRNDPLGPHGIAFLYADPVPGRQDLFELRAGTRLFLDGEDVRDLHRVVYEINDVARRRILANPHQSVVPHLVNRFDDDLTSAATYYGVAVSSLDGMDGTWADVLKTANGPQEVGGRCYILLADECRIIMDRPARAYGALLLRSSLYIDAPPAYRWSRLDRSNISFQDDQTFLLMRTLHEEITQNYRWVATHGGRRGGR